MTKFKNKYRIPSARLQTWDYGSNGAYFITICTQHRKHYFGNIQNETFIPTDIGALAIKYWMEIPSHFPFVELGNFVVMPNHIHGIIIISKHTVETLQCNVSTGDADTPDKSDKNEKMANISPKSGTISTIIRSYKSIVSKHAHQLHAEFAWQPRFYDHIIRNAQAYNNIHHYIANNVLNWEKDNFNKPRV
jgi:putative transposase